MSPLRFLTPGQLLICLILFFLPWVEIQCPAPDLGNIGAGLKNLDPKEPPKKVDLKTMSYTPFMTQSGLQVATGGYSLSNAMFKQELEQAKKGGKGDLKSAPLLFVYPLAAVAAVVVGLVMPGGVAKKGILVGCCVLALASAGIQAAIGFPVETEIKEAQRKEEEQRKKQEEALKKQQDELKKQGVVIPGGANLGGPKVEGDVMKTVYQIPFFLALLLPVGGLVTALLEPSGPAGGRKPKRRRYGDEEDDDVGDAEPLPLDDEEDRPRRKRRDEIDEDDDRPRRRDRDRDRDDDDRPRRREADRDEPRDRGGRDDRGKRGGAPRKEDPDNPFANLE